MKRPGSASTRTRRGSLTECGADGRAEFADIHGVLQVVDRKAAADIERIERAEPLAARAGEQPRARRDRLHVLERIGSLGADVK